MKYARLGNSGLKVSRIILGCGTYGNPAWQAWVLGEKDAFEHIKFAYDAGITTFDTADVYSNGESEIILGRALKEFKIPREDIVIMTKLFMPVVRGAKLPAGNPDDFGYVNQHGLSRKHIFNSVKASLKRLDLDYIDLFLCHRFDYQTPIEETMQALHDVVKAGYARYIGMSSCWAWQFHAMQNYAISHNLTPFILMQNHYSLIYREEEREMMPTLKHFGVASIPWSALAKGVLTRPWGEATKRSETDSYMWAVPTGGGTQEIVNRVESLAKQKGVKMAQIAVAWNLAKTTAPIVGTTSLDKLQETIDSLKIELTEEDIKYLEEPYKPMGVIGHR
jgi:aryl-alcohol dehydrogenase-like predicted oxidoreductase